jgi:hypothetical protein
MRLIKELIFGTYMIIGCIKYLHIQGQDKEEDRKEEITRGLLTSRTVIPAHIG